MSKKISLKNVLVIGFALFAMFFGAGNLIFPPYLGFVSGRHWIISFLGFLIADAGLAFLAIYVVAKFDGKVEKLFNKVGKNFSFVLTLIIILCISVFIGSPRTCATTYEIAVVPIFGDFVNRYIFSVIYFAIVFALTVKPSKVVAIVGKYLTPVLLVTIAFLIIKGIFTPYGDVSSIAKIDNILEQGIKDGYQTMDAIASCVFALIIVNEVKSLGLSSIKLENRAILMSGVVATAGLGLVYGGLGFLGAKLSAFNYPVDVDKTTLIVDLTNFIIGKAGVKFLALIVTLPCITTAIGLISSAGHYFTNISHGKLKYELNVFIINIVSAVISMLGVEKIIKFSAPLLDIIYPCVITLLVLGIFSKYIKSTLQYKITAYVAIITGFLFMLADKSSKIVSGELISKLPFERFGLAWVLPVFIAFVLSCIISKLNPVNND